MFIAITCLAVTVYFGNEYRLSSEIDGTWVGTGVHQNVTLKFQRRVLTLTNLAGSLDSQFQLYPANGSIRILSENGWQEGLYRLTGETLELRIANIGRPTPVSAPSPVKEAGTVYYVLQHQSK